MNEYVTTSGPIFDGRAVRASKDFIDDWEQEYSGKVEDAVQNRLSSVLKHPTGNYQRHIRTRQEGDGRTVDDSSIVYGPWLEGTSSRNQTTRFKGYSTFRRTAQAMDRAAEAYADQMVRRYLSRMQ